MEHPRQDLVFFAKLAEQAERYNEMLQYCKGFTTDGNTRLTLEERTLISVAYKNVTGCLRSNWRILRFLEHEDDTKPTGRKLDLLRRQRQKVERELADACRDAIQFAENNLDEKTTNLSPECKVFYLKMKGDYLRYVVECSAADDRALAQTSSLEAYKQGYQLGLSDLKATHPTRLGLALNFSVFYHDVMNSPERACHLAKHAFDEAIADMDAITEATVKDVIIILQLLRDDLTLWYKEMQDPGAAGDGPVHS